MGIGSPFLFDLARMLPGMCCSDRAVGLLKVMAADPARLHILVVAAAVASKVVDFLQLLAFSHSFCA